MPANLPLIYGCPSLLDRLMDLADIADKLALPAPEETGVRHFPPLQIFEDATALYVRAIVAGLSREHITLALDANALSISGVIPLLPGRHLRRDRPVGPFRRDVRLPFQPDPAAVQAVMTNGLLTVTLPKRAEGEKRSIPVTVPDGETP